MLYVVICQNIIIDKIFSQNYPFFSGRCFIHISYIFVFLCGLGIKSYGIDYQPQPTEARMLQTRHDCEL